MRSLVCLMRVSIFILTTPLLMGTHEDESKNTNPQDESYDKNRRDEGLKGCERSNHICTTGGIRTHKAINRRILNPLRRPFRHRGDEPLV